MIHVCYTLYDKNGKYSKNIGTSMLSIFENTKEWITIHLLHDNTLTEANKALFIKLVRKYGHYIRFYNVEKLDLPSMAAIEEWGAKARFSKAALYRLLVGKVIPSEVQRLIYLDADIIFNLDIKELWKEDLKGAPLGAVSDYEVTYHHSIPWVIVEDGTIEKHRYFNSGVMLIDMTAFSAVEGIVEDGLAWLAVHPNYKLYDMDILNHYFSTTYQPLDIRYGLYVEAERRVINTQEIKPAVYHYLNQELGVYRGDAFDKLWTKYYVMSPWFTGDTFCDVCRISATAVADMLNSFWMSVRGRSLTLVGSSMDIERFQKLLGLGQGDRFLSLYDESGRVDIRRVIADMKKHMSDIEARKPLYMFVSPYYPQFFQQISEAGFKVDVDFIEATWLINALEHNYPKNIGVFVWENI